IIVASQLVVEPDVPDCQTELLEQMENQFQFSVDERFAGDMPVKNGHADHSFPIEHRNRHLRSQQIEFFLGFRVAPGFFTVATQDAAQSGHLAADAVFEGQLEMFEQPGRQADGAGGPQTAALFQSQLASQSMSRLTYENGSTIDPQQFPQQQQKL